MEALIVSGSLDSLGKIGQYIMSAGKEAGLEKKASYKLRLAVDEIATNIITHGYDEAGLAGDISIQAEINEQNLTVYIEDTAIPYDPTQAEMVTEETLQQALEKRPMGGLGVYLAKDSVDRFMYKRVGDKNRNILIVNRIV
ncbi:MAG: ATP-binding protein [Okeania sp. SIO3B3]|nr:ATP-binding protein [Okeania sp. SIO3B3]